MKKLYFLLFTILTTAFSFGQAAGDLAFVGFNADGDDDFALVALTDIAANTTYYFSDDELNGAGGFVDSNEGNIQWITPATTISAGTIITFTDTDSGSNPSFGTSQGTLTYVGSGSINLSSGGDALYLYVGMDQDNPTVFIAGIQNEANNQGNLAGSGLTEGSTFVTFTNSGNPDGGEYSGLRSGFTSFSDYLSLIGSPSNWTTETSNGENILPINATAFTISMNAMPTISITAPSDATVLNDGTTSVDITWSTFNTQGDEFANITINGNTFTNETSPYTLSTADGETYSVTVELFNQGGSLDSDNITFSVAFPCVLSIDSTVETCDSINEGAGDTYNTVVSFSNGGTSTYTIDTGGIGTVVDGTNLNTMTTGTFSVTGIPENTNLVINFIGDPANSGCDFTRFISSPICDPQLELPFTNNFEYGAVAGDLTTASTGEWEAHSGSGNGPVQYSENSLVFTDYDARASFGGSAIVNPSSSEDVSLPFAEQTSGTVYMSALVNVSAVNGNNYFMHFLGGGFTARVAAQSDGGTGINFGIGATGSATFGSTSFDLNTVYLVVASYNIDSGLSNLYVLTSPTGSEPSSPEATNTGGSGTSVSAVALRQSGGIPNATIDGIRVAKTWSNLSLSNNDFETREFSIFPNPTNTGEVNITTVNASPIAVAVFDILGKQVKNETISNNRLDVSNLKAGVYLLRLTQDNATSTKKLVIK